MKKLLDNKIFVWAWITLQAFLLVAGILVAINDDGHASVALLILVIVFSCALNIILVLLSLFLKITKKWVYVGIMAFWLVGSAPMFYEFYEAYSMNNQYEKLMEEMDEEQLEEMDEDTKQIPNG